MVANVNELTNSKQGGCRIRNAQLILKAMSNQLDSHNDAIRDIAIAITNKLIELGYVSDCTDTDDESEFEVQDTIVEVLELSIPLGTFDGK